MATIVHRGQCEFGELRLGATLTLETGRVTLEVVGSGDMVDGLSERIGLLRFTSNTGYFTLLSLFRRSVNTRLGVGSLSTYAARLALESGYFSSEEEIRSRSWSMHVEDIAKIIHVNGVHQHMIMPEQGGFIMHWTIASPPAVVLECPDAGVTIRLGQHIRTGGDIIRGPSVSLSYPAEVVFPEKVEPDAALQMIHRVRLFFSMLMGRMLPITEASVRFEVEDRPHDMPIHGLLPTEPSDKPSERLVGQADAPTLARMLDCWLVRYDELEDAIRLHTSALEQRRLPVELRFQIFVQALEALHRRTAPSVADPIDAEPVLAALRDRGVPNGVVDRVAGVLAHAHEPGLRQRLRDYWNTMTAEIAALRPTQTRSRFVGRVVATRNHYAHRTDREDQVLEGAELWDATELVKAISHMALLTEISVDITGMGQAMLDRRFTEFSMEAA